MAHSHWVQHDVQVAAQSQRHFLQHYPSSGVRMGAVVAGNGIPGVHLLHQWPHWLQYMKSVRRVSMASLIHLPTKSFGCLQRLVNQRSVSVQFTWWCDEIRKLFVREASRCLTTLIFQVSQIFVFMHSIIDNPRFSLSN